MTLVTVLERRFAMKDLGKTIAKHRKDHKLKQSQLAIELEKYDIYVKPNTVSAWESGLSQPNSRQLLAICELLDIHDIYTEFLSMYLGKERSFIQRYLPVPDHFWMATIMKCTPLLTFQKKQLLVYMSVETAWNLATIMKNLSGLNKRNILKTEKSVFFTLMEMHM